jgi:uncharacterized protein (TIGR03067 family)
MSSSLPARPNIEYLKHQAKALLAALNAGDADAARLFINHLPAASSMTVAAVARAGFRLADAQSAIARQAGFASWAALSRHVTLLSSMQGTWTFLRLEIDGAAMPATALAAELLMDGNRFRMNSPEAAYDGVFTIDATQRPHRIDIDFVEGPEAGNRAEGIFQLDGDDLTICVGVVGATRPLRFVTTAGSGHALEILRRASAARPANVTGGTAQSHASAPAPAAPIDEGAFAMAITPLLEALQGTWRATALVRDGKAMPAEWLAFGTRVTAGNDVRVVFGGQTMLHARMRLDDTQQPVAVDYLNLSGAHARKISLGIMDWHNGEARFLIAAPGQDRPRNFDEPIDKASTLSIWRRN